MARLAFFHRRTCLLVLIYLGRYDVIVFGAATALAALVKCAVIVALPHLADFVQTSVERTLCGHTFAATLILTMHQLEFLLTHDRKHSDT